MKCKAASVTFIVNIIFVISITITLMGLSWRLQLSDRRRGRLPGLCPYHFRRFLGLMTLSGGKDVKIHLFSHLSLSWSVLLSWAVRTDSRFVVSITFTVWVVVSFVAF